MSGEINIYGLLRSSTLDGVLVETTDIKDLSLNKKQSEINSEYKEKIDSLESELVEKVQIPVGFNSFISKEVKIEIYGSPGTGTKDNMYYYNYGSFHKFIMLHTDGKYYDQFSNQEDYMADFNNPKTNTRFVDITGTSYYYDGSQLLSFEPKNYVVKILAKYDDSLSFSETAKKLINADYFFAKIDFKVSDGKYVRVFFNGDLKADEGVSSLPVTLVGMSIQGKPYRMVATGGTIEIEEIV